MTKAEANPSAVLVDDVHTALKLWRKPQDAGSPLHALLLFQQARAVPHTSDRLATKTVLLRALQTLEQTHSLEATILRQRYLEGQSAHSVANRVNLSEATLFRRENEGLVLLTAIIQQQENAARAGRLSALTARLETSTYSRLIGVDTHLERLSAALTASGPPWLLALEGTGGIGKTSLADALMRHWVHTNLDAEIGWVSAPPQIFSVRGGIRLVEKPALTADALVDALVGQLLPGLELRPPTERLAALRSCLKEKAHVIVVDNLETVVDVSSLLSILRDLANPTRFVLTSRQSLFEEADIFHYPIPELDEPNALAFVRWEATLRNLPALQQAADQDLRPIYDTLGGNPLALRLVVGLTHTHALDTVLADLTAARGTTIENLYLFIYRRAWEQLDDATRQVFLAMPLVSARGDTIDFLADVSNLDVTAVQPALERLVALNLVDSRGELHERRYTIHNLTRAFLREQVARWIKPDFPSPPAAPNTNMVTKTNLVRALLGTKIMENRSWRSRIVAELPPAVRFSVQRSDMARQDVIGIVNAAANYPGGLVSLLETTYIFTAHFFEEDPLLDDLNHLIRELAEPYYPVPTTAIYEARSDTQRTPSYSAQDMPKVEAYALATLQGPTKSLRLLFPYKLLAGVSSKAREGFAAASIELPTDVMVDIDIFVHAKHIEVHPYWKQTVRYSHGHESDLATFVLTPISRGSDLITVEFYYERHWLTKIEIEVAIIRKKAVNPIE